MFLYVCMYGLSCTCCTCTCAGRRSRSGLFPNSSLPCLMKQGHEINLKLSDKVNLLDTKSHSSICLCLPRAGVAGRWCSTWLYHECWGLNSSPHIYADIFTALLHVFIHSLLHLFVIFIFLWDQKVESNRNAGRFYFFDTGFRNCGYKLCCADLTVLILQIKFNTQPQCTLKAIHLRAPSSSALYGFASNKRKMTES